MVPFQVYSVFILFYAHEKKKNYFYRELTPIHYTED